MKDKWLIKVFENNKPAYTESFQTRKQALAFAETITNSNIKWSCELAKIGNK